MNKLLSCMMAMLISQAVYSQKDYFVYLQSEGNQPFFVRMNEQTYSSSAHGYLILSRMRDSSYTFRVGWPGKPEEQPYFTLKVGAKDRGLLLKNFTGEGWGLFDLQTLEVVKSHAAPATNSSVKLEPRTVSNFTDVLAKAANDPSLRMKEVKVEKPVVKEPVEKKEEPAVAKKEEVQKEPVKETPAPPADTTALVANKPGQPEPVVDTVAKKPATQAETLETALDTAAVVTTKPKVEEKIVTEESPVKNEPVVVKEEKPVVKQEPVVAEEQKQSTIYARSKVSRRSESSTTEGFTLTFVDEYVDGHRDTIKILIPNAAKAWQKEPAKVPVAEEKKFLDIPVTATDTQSKASVKTNTCKLKANESDFLKLRKKMAATTTDDGMIREARKGFEQKCYTTKQVRNLGSLFLNDAAKFQFFEAASNYISDVENLASLGDDLKNEYYLRRFKTVLEKR